MSDHLREKLIRLAHAQPELRGELLPLLKQAAPARGSLDAAIRQAIEEWELLVTDALLPLLNELHVNGTKIRWKNNRGSNHIKVEIPDGEGGWTKDDIYIEGPYLAADSGELTVQLESGPRGRIKGVGGADPKYAAKEAMKWLSQTLVW